MDQNKPPLLFTSSTELIELMPEHARDVFAFTSDEQVAKTAIWDAHKTSDDSLLYINHVRSRISFDPKNLFLCWGIKELSTQKIIGFITLTEIGGIRAQIGYVFHYKKWDSKLPAECLQVVTQYALEQFSSLERIQCRCFPTNQNSIRLLEKVGYHSEGINQAMVKVRGELQDLACFSMTRKRWRIFQHAPSLENEHHEHL